jgi:ubiquinone/menaquinone biosynthesis C-methylase UbiE
MNVDPAAQKAQIRAAFDRLAPRYDVAGPGCFAHYGRRLVEVVAVESGQRVLDVAAGRGAVLFAAAEQVGSSGEVVGIDLSDGMAQQANAEAERLGLAARVRVGDAEALVFPDAAFDRVVCGFGVMFFPDRQRALGEMRRVLRPGGRLGISTWRRTQAADLGEVLQELGLGGAEAGWITEPDELRSLLESAGFQDVRVQVDPTTFVFADLDEYWRNAQATGLARFLGALDPEQTERVRAALAERVRPHQRSDGLHLDASALLAVATR